MAEEQKKPAKTKHKGQFKKGQSGNPSGRPKKSRELEEAIRSMLEVGGKNIAVQGVLDLAMYAENESVRLAAMRDLLDRGYGKPRQRTELTGKDGAELFPVEIVTLPDNGRDP